MLGDVLEYFVRVGAFVSRRVNGRHSEIVPSSAAKSRNRIGGNVAYVQALPERLEICSRRSSVIHPIAAETWVRYGIPSQISDVNRRRCGRGEIPGKGGGERITCGVLRCRAQGCGVLSAGVEIRGRV